MCDDSYYNRNVYAIITIQLIYMQMAMKNNIHVMDNFTQSEGVIIFMS